MPLVFGEATNSAPLFALAGRKQEAFLSLSCLTRFVNILFQSRKQLSKRNQKFFAYTVPYTATNNVCEDRRVRHAVCKMLYHSARVLTPKDMTEFRGTVVDMGTTSITCGLCTTTQFHQLGASVLHSPLPQSRRRVAHHRRFAHTQCQPRLEEWPKNGRSQELRPQYVR